LCLLDFSHTYAPSKNAFLHVTYLQIIHYQAERVAAFGRSHKVVGSDGFAGELTQEDLLLDKVGVLKRAVGKGSVLVPQVPVVQNDTLYGESVGTPVKKNGVSISEICLEWQLL
jgi:hypothetical protein